MSDILLFVVGSVVFFIATTATLIYGYLTFRESGDEGTPDR